MTKNTPLIIGIDTVVSKVKSWLRCVGYSSAVPALLIVVGAVTLYLIALWNGWPLLHQDTGGYYSHGTQIVTGPLPGRPYGPRAGIYALTLSTISSMSFPWPMIGIQSLILSYLLYLCFRVTLPATQLFVFLIIITTLSLLTSASWHASTLMPDIFAATTILGIFLVGRCGTNMHWIERLVVAAIIWFSIVSHGSHFLLSIGLVLFLLLSALFDQDKQQRRLLLAGRVIVIIVVAALSQLALFGSLYKEISLFGHHHPFLLSRIVSDAPGKKFLQEHCDDHTYAICSVKEEMATHRGSFLWNKNSPRWKLSPKRLRDEGKSFALAVFHKYPFWQLSQMMRNTFNQLVTFSVKNVKIDRTKTNRLHKNHVTKFLNPVIYGSVIIAACMLCLILGRQLKSPGFKRIHPLAVLIVVAIFGNAFICGALSGIHGRYQARIMWLVPFVVCLYVISLFSKKVERE